MKPVKITMECEDRKIVFTAMKRERDVRKMIQWLDQMQMIPVDATENGVSVKEKVLDGQVSN